MRVRAFAKINLSLRVAGSRDDGYHELRTIFQSIALHDTLTFHRRRGPFALTCDDPACPSDDTNLIWRAAARMWKAAGRSGPPRDVAVAVKKRIPLQAGLGGGSSDAAAALRVCARLWRAPDPSVAAAAVELGADVPYFLEGGTVLGLERGDLLFPLIDYPASWVVLVLPAFGVSTKKAFAWWDAARSGRSGRLARSGRVRRVGGSGSFRGPGGLSGSQHAGELVNDLEAPVAAHHPEIARIVRALRAERAHHTAMSGSGSAVFGLFQRRADAARAAAALETRTRRTVLTRTLNRSKYQRLAAN
jgi:4-diphosphocytidyl-2-C-methyl-D-erythritol kinase